MQTPSDDDVLSPDYSDHLNYFNPLSHSASPIYEDDPWTTISNNNSIHFDEQVFDLDLTPNNVLCKITYTRIRGTLLTVYSRN